MVSMWLTGIRKCLMTVDFDTAARTLVIVSMGQTREKRVTASLIVAVLSRKFSNVPEELINQIVNSMIIEEGGMIDELAMNQEPVAVLDSTDITRRLSTDLKDI